MKKIKKFLTAGLAAAMTLSLLTGCGNSNSKTENETTSSENSEQLVSANVDDKYGACYQVFIYSFCDSDGDGIGDFNGLTSKLDYIQDLGFDSIWLLPFNQSTTYHKYDVVDYYTVDTEYGTMEDFENLMAECDKRNLDVYMDFVINHSSSQNEWFKTAKAYIQTLPENGTIDYTACPEAEWYNFLSADEYNALKDKSGYGKVSGSNNWYYECQFWSEMPDFNLDSESLRTEIETIAKFWVDKGIDGFRLDAALHYYEGNNDKSTEALKWFCDYVYSMNPDLYCVAEVWSDSTTNETFYESGIDSLFDFTLADGSGYFATTVNRKGNGSCGKKLVKAMLSLYNGYKAANENFIDGVFVANHDTGRQAGFMHTKSENIKLSAAFTLFTTGKAFVYYGDELGMSGTTATRDEDARTAMYWSDDANAEGMTTGPAAASVQEHKFGSYETQKDDPYSIYNYYKDALLIRNAFPSIARGVPSGMDDVMEQDGNLYALAKTYNDETTYVIINVSDEASTVTVSKDTYNYSGLAASLSVDETEATLDGETLTIPANGVVVLK